jgi:hypothetical protein
MTGAGSVKAKALDAWTNLKIKIIKIVIRTDRCFARAPHPFPPPAATAITRDRDRQLDSPRL